MTSSWAIAGLILGPLAAAALAFAFPRRGRWAAWAAALLSAAGLGVLTRDVLAGGVQIHRVGGWSAPLGIDLRADGLAVLMLAITSLIASAVTLYARRYFLAGHDTGALHRERYFWPLFLFLWTGLNALFLTADLFNLYVTLELLGLAAVILVALGGGREALAAAMRYLWVSLSASLFYLLGVALVYGQCATVDLPSLAARAQPGPTLGVALALMTGGLIAKAALFPLHFWLPPAHANAPTPVSALLSALVVKGPFTILLRLWFEAFPGFLTPAVAQGFGVLGSAAILWGSVHALVQPRLKLLVAYSTVAQLGYLFLLFPLAAGREGGFLGWSGGLIFLGAHACAKAAMFLSAGNILQAAGHDRIKDLEGLTQGVPLSAFAFGLAGLSLVGLPPSSGFAGKWLLLGAGLAQGQWWWVAVILAGSLLAAAYVIRVLTRAFTQVPGRAMPDPIPPAMEWTALALALLAVGLGLAARWPADLLRWGAPAALESSTSGSCGQQVKSGPVRFQAFPPSFEDSMLARRRAEGPKRREGLMGSRNSPGLRRASLVWCPSNGWTFV
ncbi:MAG TPA: proton-conducting transporter membrane subunit, partial [Verrucomicrobiota bacterium]|nr:proton-conducting transporter membrane subunit [Verrucomicrobiota bacterium]HNU50379.1 proton-conducting transporter membrane subunit [Verrucomicrobiota bacterium]